MMNNNSATYLYLLFVFIVGISNSQTVTIGNQTWMTKNLDVSTFRNGDTIPEIKNGFEWERAGIEGRAAWCYFDNDTVKGKRCGKLYNWYAVFDPRGLAPTGYHIPTREEWTVLEKFLDGNSVKMKQRALIQADVEFVNVEGYYETKWVPCNNCSYWTEKQKANNPCSVCRNERGKTIKTGKYIPKSKVRVEHKKNLGWDGTNESGFSALPCGCRWADNYLIDSFVAEDMVGKWWSNYSDDKYRPLVFKISSYIGFEWDDKANGLSVRCIKDSTE
jgi:uncharacterized protein (TIGR02145 family)